MKNNINIKESYLQNNSEKNSIEVTQLLSLFIKVPNINGYWRVLKSRIKKESGNYGKKEEKKLYYQIKRKEKNIEVITIQQFFRIIQSIPSKEVEEVKVWMAKKAEESLNKGEDIPNVLKKIQKIMNQN